MSFTYPKSEKLKSRKLIESLFSEGKSVAKYPLRLMYVKCPQPVSEPLQIGVSVPKKYFKKATDRNYVKRMLRESYRLNKAVLHDRLQQPYAFMLMYQNKEMISFSEIMSKTAFLFDKFHNVVLQEGNNKPPEDSVKPKQ